MNPSEKPKFEQEWQRLFESASETPPSSAWEAIEKHLDDQKAVVIPLVWWKNPRLFYAAAAVVALLLVSWPILRSGTESDSQENRSEVATKSLSQPTQPASTVGAVDGRPASESLTATEKSPDTQPTLSTLDRVAIIEKSARNQPADAEGFVAKIPRRKSSSLVTGSSPDRAKVPSSLAREGTLAAGADKENAFLTSAPTLIAFAKSNRKNANTEIDHIITDSATAVLRTPVLTRSIAALSPIGISEVEVYVQKRYVHFRYDIVEPELPRRSRGRELWAGLGIMPAYFNPQMNVKSSPLAFTNANANRQALASSSKPQLSYALQLQGGKKLSKRWSVETGMSYLQGNSTFQSDGYVLNAITSRSANLLEDALFSNNKYANSALQSPGFAPSFDKNASSYIELAQRTDNDYRYVQLPVQAGYTLNPDGKLNYTVLAGVVGNLFLQNEVQSTQGYSFKNTADDGLYRSLNWSAATGLRINYRLAGHWNASLTGSYQKAIDSILRDNSTLDSRPQLYGVAWGVQYIF